MATKKEETQKDTWWLNELESLGVSPKVKNELNDIQETSNLAENLKQRHFIRPTKKHIMMCISDWLFFARPIYFLNTLFLHLALSFFFFPGQGSHVHRIQN